MRLGYNGCISILYFILQFSCNNLKYLFLNKIKKKKYALTKYKKYIIKQIDNIFCNLNLNVGVLINRLQF